jgi:hypothetical protein
MVCVTEKLRKDGHQWRHKTLGVEYFVSDVRSVGSCSSRHGKVTRLALIMICLSAVANAASRGQVGLVFLVRSQGLAVNGNFVLFNGASYPSSEGEGETAL